MHCILYDVFKNNVSDYWWRKAEFLTYMDTEIKQIQDIRSKAE